MKSMGIEEKLAVNKFNIDENNPHIVILRDSCDMAALKRCIIACPAGLYIEKEDGSIAFDHAGCLECGTCRILCAGTKTLEWNYPQGTFGIEFRYG